MNREDVVRARWAAYDPETLPSVTATPMQEHLIPLYGTPDFATLTDAEKRSLYLAFIQLNAEGSMLFEQLLLFAFRRLPARREFEGIPGRASNKLVYEEFLHSKAFRRFLVSELAFEWPGKKIMIGGKRLRRALMWVVARAPLALCVWGVKIESFSVFYAQYLRQLEGSWSVNRWTKLHEYHLIDEAHHVPIQLDLYRREFVGKGLSAKLRMLPAVYLLVGLVQVLLFRGSWGMIRLAFPESGALKRFGLTLKVARWSVRQLDPYQKARKKAQALFATKEPPLRRLLAFIHW